MNYIFNEIEINTFKLILTYAEYESLFSKLVNKGAVSGIAFNEVLAQVK